MSAYLRFVAVPTVDTPATLLTLNFDDKRYLFGQVAEGSQRICLQRGLNLIKTKAVFLSGQIGWQNTGGVTGLALTLADSLNAHAKALEEAGKADTLAKGEEQGLTVYGGNGLLHSVASGRKYIFRAGGYIRFREFEPLPEEKPDFEDKNIRVWTIRSNPSSVDKAIQPTEAQQAAKTQVKKIVTDMWESSWRRDHLEEVQLQHVQLPVKAIWIRDQQTKDLVPYTGPLPDGKTVLADPTMKVLVRKPWPGAISGDLPRYEPDGTAISYLLKTYPRRGKFREDKAKELKVVVGPDYSRLASGESVQNIKGQTITPDMVLEPEVPGQSILILDVPSASYFDDLFNQLDTHGHGRTIHEVQVVVWILAPGLAQHQSLDTFMEKTKHIKHLIASRDSCSNSITLHSSKRLTALLSSVLSSNIATPVSHDSVVDRTDNVQELSGVGPARIDVEIALKPEFKLQQVPPEPKPDLEIAPRVHELVGIANRQNEQYAETFQQWRKTLASPDAEVIFLGTGSAIPGLTRNVTGILLRVPGHGNYILDCGENTVGQLQRMFPADEFDQILHDLRMVWISHMHADHHLGTIGLLKSWYKTVHGSTALPKVSSSDELHQQILRDGSTNGRLPIVANRNFHEMIADFAQLEDIGYSRVLPIVHIPAVVNEKDNTLDQPTELFLAINLLAGMNEGNFAIDKSLHACIFGSVDLESVYVKHCRGASGLALTFHPLLIEADTVTDESTSRPFRVAWSGDCRPSRQLAVIGQDADLLIHECTFGSGFEGQAKAKAHSTMKEAIRVAEAMGAKSLILTHFSQRYSRLPDMAGLSSPLEGKETARERLLKAIQEEESLVVEEGDEGEGEGAELLIEADPTNVNGQEAAGQSEAIDTVMNEASDAADAIPAFIPSPLPLCPAFDFMRIRVGDIPLMQAFTPALIELFREPEKPVLPIDDPAGNASAYAIGEPNSGKSASKKKRNDPAKQQAKKKRRKTLETPPQQNDVVADEESTAAAAAAVPVATEVVVVPDQAALSTTQSSDNGGTVRSAGDVIL